MSTRRASELETGLGSIEKKFRDRIIKYYLQIKDRASKAILNNEYDSAGIVVGKFCETILRFLQSEVIGTYTQFGTKISNFPDECRQIIKAPGSHNESIKKIIPRSIVFMYVMRNTRDIGHIGGDIEANIIDNKTLVQISDWIICELIRIYHKISLEEAQAIVDSLSSKDLPIIWEVAGTKRILKNNLNYSQKILILLYSEKNSAILLEDLFKWSNHSLLREFKRILRKLDKENEIHFDENENIIYLSPLGAEKAQKLIIEKNPDE